MRRSTVLHRPRPARRTPTRLSRHATSRRRAEPRLHAGSATAVGLLARLAVQPWTRALALLIATLLSAGGLAFSDEYPPRTWLGAAAPLVPLWLVWATLLALPRPRIPRPGRQMLAGAALLSLALPPLFSLQGAGGTLGRGGRELLDEWLGGSGALFLLALLACCGPLLMLGKRRGPIATGIVRAIERQAEAGRSSGSRRRSERTVTLASAGRRGAVGRFEADRMEPRHAAASRRNAEHELVILGPGGEPLREQPRRASQEVGREQLAASPETTAFGRSAQAPAHAAGSVGAVLATPSAATRLATSIPLPTRQAAAARPASGWDPRVAPGPRPADSGDSKQPTDPGHWKLPSTDLLSTTRQAAVSPTDLKAQAAVIEQTLETFRLPVKVVEVRQGPAVSQFGLEPAPGVAVDRVAARSHDLALRLGARSIRIQAPIPGRTLIGVEVPNGETSVVSLRETLEQAAGREQLALPVALGKDVAGQPVVVDLARLPHLLIAGATGSGKSVGLNALLVSLLLARTPDEVQLILVDPKRVELTAFTGIPHLRMPVLTEMELVLGALRWALVELESRFSRFAAATCRNIEMYNQRYGSTQRIPRLVIVVDELADLMMTVPDEVERCLCRLAQLGRAAGIHLVVATQRPSVDVLTGLIKANFPARVSFAVSSLTDSRVVLDTAGAEQLLGRGDMLFQAPDAARPRRVQGAYVEERELRQVVSHWRRQGGPRFRPEEEVQLHDLGRQALADPDDELLGRARELADEHDSVTASFLQRKLGIGYPKAAKLMQRLKDLEMEDEDLP